MAVIVYWLKRLRFVNLCVFLVLLTGCFGGDAPLSYEKPPTGVPDTPYWFQIRDSLFWYQPAESLAVVQMMFGRAEAEKSNALQSLRKLGWRMSVERSRALQRPTDAQELSQTLFTVERVPDALTPLHHYGKFRSAFWKGTDTTLMGWLPGLLQQGQGGAQYFWPSVAMVVWKPGVRAIEAQRLIDSLGFDIIKPTGLTQNYWVDRAWTVVLSAGSDLYTWLRWFNRDSRVHLAHPVQATREPPVPDQRFLRKFEPVSDSLTPEQVQKLSVPLRKAWEISQFCGHTGLVTDNTGVPSDGSRLHVLIALADGSIDIASVIETSGGEVIATQPNVLDVWIPYTGLPTLAADPRVLRMEEVRANLLGE